MRKLAWTALVVAGCGFPRPADVLPADDGGANGDGGSGDTACQLIAIEPAAAHASDTVTLEGTFAGSVMVTFPGAVTASATVLGPHRATVVVPDGVTQGNLTVAACNAVLGPLPFRRLSFVVNIGMFGSIYDQATTARQTPKLQVARPSATAAAIGEHIFVVGGAGSSGPLSGVEQATINADDTLGPFAVSAASSLVVARQAHTMVLLKDQLYVVGGANDGSLASVERATVAHDGSLGAFAMAPETHLVAKRSGHASVVIGDSLYILGGVDGAPLSSVERTTVNADGSLGPFAIVPGVQFATARQGHAALVFGSFLYVVGGTGSGGPLDDVERAPINGDGTLGPFSVVAGATLHAPRTGHTALVLGGALYVLGGSDNSGPLNSVEAASIDASGSLGLFGTSADTLTTARHDHAMVVVGNHLYLLGGAAGSALANIEWATLPATGELTVPTAAGISFVAPRAELAAVTIGNYLYVIGGTTTNANTIERSTIGPDGFPGLFMTVPDIALSTARHRHSAAVIGNFVYVIGGDDANGPISTVERAPINTDGSLGAFAAAAGLSGARTEHACAVIGNSVYVVGGANATAVLDSVERATINSDGSLGPFGVVSGIKLNTAGQGLRAVVIRDKLTVLGGDAATVEQAPINSDGSLGAFAGAGSIPTSGSRFETSVLLTGRELFVMGGDPMAGQAVSTFRYSLSVGAALGSGGVSQIGSIRRFGHATVSIGNFVYILGGFDMLGSTASPLVSELRN